MNRLPNISVVMPTHNDAHYLPSAIDSILHQTFEDFELIIVDDASADETPEVLVKYVQQDSRVRVIRNAQNLGVARSLNRGLDVVRGKLIARMDSDDVSLPDRLEKQRDFLNVHTDVGVVGAQTIFIDQDSQITDQPNWEKPTSHNLLIWRLLYSTPICHPSVMMRSQLVQRIGGYDPKYLNEDMKLWTEMAFITKLTNLEDILLYYRMPPKKHVERLIHWKPHIQRVGREYAERLLGHPIAPKLIQLFFEFQNFDGYFEEKSSLVEMIQVCSMIEDVFAALKRLQLFELDTIEAVERLKFHQLQGLVSAAFQ